VHFQPKRCPRRDGNAAGFHVRVACVQSLEPRACSRRAGGLRFFQCRGAAEYCQKYGRQASVHRHQEAAGPNRHDPSIGTPPTGHQVPQQNGGGGRIGVGGQIALATAHFRAAVVHCGAPRRLLIHLHSISKHLWWFDLIDRKIKSR